MEENLVPLTADEVYREIVSRKHSQTARTRKENRGSVKDSGEVEMVPLTADEVYDGIMYRKRKTHDDVPIEEQKRIGDLIRAKQREIDIEEAKVAFGLVPPAPPAPAKKRGRPYNDRPSVTRCATPGCPFKAKGEYTMCLRCRRHADKGNLPGEMKWQSK